MQIAVTGATGFLGRRICEMALARGHQVIATGRDAAKGERLARPELRFVASEITDVNRLSEAVSGAEAVIHCAALSAPWGRHADFEAANVEGTLAVKLACERQGVRRLIHVSTSSVYFAPKHQPGLTEHTVLPAPFNSYAATKQRAEIVALGFSGETMVLRPRGIFGPGDTSLLPRLVKAARRGPLPLLNGGAARVSLCHADVAASAVLAMIDAPRATCGVYNVAHAEDIEVRELIETLLGGLGVPFSWRSLPVPVALGAARFIELTSRLRPGQPEPITTVYGLALLSYTQTLDISAIRDRLGWSPPFSLEEGLARTVTAYREGGLEL